MDASYQQQPGQRRSRPVRNIFRRCELLPGSRRIHHAAFHHRGAFCVRLRVDATVLSRDRLRQNPPPVPGVQLYLGAHRGLPTQGGGASAAHGATGGSPGEGEEVGRALPRTRLRGGSWRPRTHLRTRLRGGPAYGSRFRRKAAFLPPGLSRAVSSALGNGSPPVTVQSCHLSSELSVL